MPACRIEMSSGAYHVLPVRAEDALAAFHGTHKEGHRDAKFLAGNVWFAAVIDDRTKREVYLKIQDVISIWDLVDP